MRLRFLLRLCAAMLVMTVLAGIQLSSAAGAYRTSEDTLAGGAPMIAEAEKAVIYWKAREEGPTRDAGLARAQDYLAASQAKAEAVRDGYVATRRSYMTWLTLCTACGVMALGFFGAWLRINQPKRVK